jgi:flavin-dependent dehydrogenase
VLDAIVAIHPAVITGCDVRSVSRRNDEFVVHGERFEIACRVVVDAAGKFSRFTQRRTAPQFGLQYFEPTGRGDVMDFWFLPEAYGGAVSVEGGRSNICILINKDALPGYLGKTGRLVTGPVAYDRIPGDYIAVGDAAGMMDPFCGEGMRHALDTGIMAAEVVSKGLRSRKSYEEIRWQYELEWRRRWQRKRFAAERARRFMAYPRIFSAGTRFGGKLFLRELWR